MPKFFELSVYTCFFYFLIWVIWLFLVVPVESNIESLGSLAFLPHAARVLPVLFFGGRAIPAIYFSELIATNFIGDPEYTTGFGALISSTAILISWGAFKLLDVDLEIVDPLMTMRFVIGDIVGATIVILSLMFLTGFIKIPQQNND